MDDQRRERRTTETDPADGRSIPRGTDEHAQGRAADDDEPEREIAPSEARREQQQDARERRRR